MPNNCQSRADSEPYTILFFKFSEENMIDHPLFGLLMTSALAYKAMVDFAPHLS